MTWFRFYHYLIIHLFATLALAVLVLCMARSAEASQAIPIPEETVTLAEQLDLSPLDLQGALNTTGLDVREYLYQVGHLERPRPLIIGLGTQSTTVKRMATGTPTLGMGSTVGSSSYRELGAGTEELVCHIRPALQSRSV